MCGIVGFAGRVPEGMWGQTPSIMRALLTAAEHRGRDATGFVAAMPPTGKAPGRMLIAKQPLTASKFVEANPAFLKVNQQRCDAVIGHVRLATHGSATDNRNNHPHSGRRYALVHNGIITNLRELVDRHSLRIRSECDSEALLRIVERSPHPAIGLDTCIRDVRGSMAVAVYDSKKRFVWLVRNGGRPLWLARLHGDPRTFFGSTAEIILRAMRQAFGPQVQRKLELLIPLPTDTPVALSMRGRIIAPFISRP